MKDNKGKNQGIGVHGYISHPSALIIQPEQRDGNTPDWLSGWSTVHLYCRRMNMEKKKLPDIHEPKNPPMSEKQKQAIWEQLWLTYFNDTLFAQGVITEDERNKMRVKIKARTSSRMK